jgi:hypothetical protein
MNTEIECKKCHDICIVDGEYPKFFAWCDTCHDYASGFDAFDYAVDYISVKADLVYDMMRNK